MTETTEPRERETSLYDRVITFKVSDGSGVAISRNTLTVEYEGMADAEIIGALVRVIDRVGALDERVMDDDRDR